MFSIKLNRESNPEILLNQSTLFIYFCYFCNVDFFCQNKNNGFWGINMKVSFHFLWAIFGTLGFQSVSLAQAPDSFIQSQITQVNNFPGGASALLQKLTPSGGGWGSCYVSSGPSNANCYYYFITGYTHTVNGVVFRGYPRFQRLNVNAPRYCASSRVSCSGNDASTGCFAGSGGLKTNPSNIWAANHSGEENLSAAEYAKKILIAALNDPADPCGMAQLYQETGTSSESASDLIANAKVKRTAAGHCAIQVADPASNQPAYKVFAQKHEKICKHFINLARFGNGANGIGSLSIVPSGPRIFSTTAAYNQAVIERVNAMNIPLDPDAANETIATAATAER
ncbi:MAG: hypothetical protein KGP28_07855 [Bdellovibrionales bacterium]|nr:hypothetical protein [Bdellovibrionales bacterium]